MKRRDFIAGLGSAAAWPLPALAQQPTMPVVGFIGTESPRLFENQLRAFHQGLREVGYVEGRNVAIEYRWAGGRIDLLSVLAEDLVRHKVAVIATSTNTAGIAAKAATSVIPIVVLIASDPVKLGLVDSLARPGGNVTGITSLNVDLGPKRLELLREMVPLGTAASLLINPDNPPNAEVAIETTYAAARKLGLELRILRASTETELEAAFASVRRSASAGLVIASESFFNTRYKQIAELSTRHGVPTIYQYREFAAAGGLMSYGGSRSDGYRLVGVYTGRILKGDAPGELPFQQAARIEQFVNLKTAKALGIAIPEAILVRADEVFE
jgi:putative ABC transport system substrate-binding protein